MRRLTWTTVATLSLPILVSACLRLVDHQASCKDSLDCYSDEVCITGKCLSRTSAADAGLRTCATGADCPDDGVCVAGFCEGAATARCRLNSDCPFPSVCRDLTSRCDRSCQGDVYCPMGSVCNGTMCQRSCMSRKDCPGSAPCASIGQHRPRVCADTCQDDSDCFPYRCFGGNCIDRCLSNNDCHEIAVCVESIRCAPDSCTLATEERICGKYRCNTSRGRCDFTCSTGNKPTPCRAGFVCNATGECVSPCDQREDPRCDGLLCDLVAGKCPATCTDDRDCAAGLECLRTFGHFRGYCRARPDAGR